MTNRRLFASVAIVAGSLALAGCVRTVANVVTFPVKAASQGVDWATTSQDEADRNRGREIRKQEQRDAKEQRKREKEARKRRDRDD
jgi:flagellar biosynthesis component FlhA